MELLIYTKVNAFISTPFSDISEISSIHPWFQVAEVEEKLQVVAKCEKKLASLKEYNEKLTAAVTKCRELNDWASPSNSKLKEICTSEELTPEDRVKEILILQEEARARQPELEPLDVEYKALLTGQCSSAINIENSLVILCVDSKRTTVSQDVQTRFPVQLAFAKFLSKIKGIFNSVPVSWIQHSLRNFPLF